MVQTRRTFRTEATVFIKHEDMLACLEGNLSDPTWRTEVAHRLFPEGLQKPMDEETLFRWLRTLDYHKVAGVGAELNRIATQQGATIQNLRWWDIEAKKRSLMCEVTRADYSVPICILFMWKKMDDADPHRFTSAMLSSYCWVFDGQMLPLKKRFDLEGDTSAEMYAKFKTWLQNSLPPFPDGSVLETSKGMTHAESD